jgi:hypothetical protein
MMKRIQQFVVLAAAAALTTAVLPASNASAAEARWHRLSTAQPPGVLDVMDTYATGAASFTLGMQYGDDEPIERPFVNRCHKSHCALTMLPLPAGSTIGGVASSITGTSAANVTVGGFYIDEVADAQVAALWHFDGTRWRIHLNKIPNSVAVNHLANAGHGQAWATGFSSDGTLVQVPTVYHRTGGVWRAVPYGPGGLPVACSHLGPQAVYKDLAVDHGVVVIPAVCDGVQHVFRWRNGVWRDIYGNLTTRRQYVGVSFVGHQIWMFERSNTAEAIFRRVHGSWRYVPLTGLPADVWITAGGGVDSHRVWGAGSSSAGAGTWLYDGHSWATVAIPGLTSTVSTMTTLAISRTGRVTAAGLDGAQPDQHLVVLTRR